MKPPEKKYRLPRIQRQRMEDSFEGENMGWAVSYSDLLMVLLGFFVLFFSDKDQEQKNRSSITTIARKIDASQTTPPSPGPSPTVQAKAPAQSLSDQLVATLGTDKVRTTTEGDTLTLSFRDNAYKPGQYQPPKMLRQELEAVAHALLPHSSEIEITVIGHTDNQVVKHRRDKFRDNLELSMARSLGALRHLHDLGMPLSVLRTQGSADQDIATRTLSLRIRAKMKAPDAAPRAPASQPTPTGQVDSWGLSGPGTQVCMSSSGGATAWLN